MLLIIGAIKILPGSGSKEPKPFDIKGMGVLIVALAAMMTAITSIDTSSILTSFLTLDVGGCLLLLMLLIAVFWRIEKQATDPIVEPTLFESSQITKSCIISLGTSALQSGSVFLPALLVLSLEMEPADAALLLLPGILVATVAAPIQGRLITRLGTRSIILASQVLVGIALAVYALVDMNVMTFIIASMIGGIGSAGLSGAPIRFIVLAETDNHNRTAAQGLLSVVSSIGRLLGAAMVGAVAASQGGGVNGYQSAFLALLMLGLLILLIALTLNSRSVEATTARGDAVTAK